MVKDSRLISIQQKRWQDLVAGIVISFEVLCCLVFMATKSHFVLSVGVGGVIGFALLCFNRQFREKYLGYQGDSSQPVASPAKFNSAQIEQSLLLWTMVVLLAVTAFIGLDLATHTAFSFLAIPFSIAGSLWSYRRRHLSTHPVTYLVSALAVTLILACLGSAFWGQTIEKAKNFLGSDRDLVLPLAASFLLVAVQVAYMWSLCYSRKLASSVIISAMLMMITVLIGNNFGFLLVLVLFVGLLVPTLMLFYRSAINLQPIGLSIVPRPRQLTEKYIPWRYLSKIAAASVICGCVLSLFAPQLRLPDISWDVPGIDEVVKYLPIQTDPNLPDSVLKDLPAKEGRGSAGQGNTRAVNGGSQNWGNSGQGSETDDDAGVVDEKAALQAIRNILATADRPLKTSAERKAYIKKYLQEHIQSSDCGPNNRYCFNSSRDNFQPDRLKDSYPTGLARWNPTAQIPLRPYYLAQQQTPPLLWQLTDPCPVDQQDCYKNRVFQANKQESIRTRNRLMRSIGSIDSTTKNLGSEFSGNSSGQQGSQWSGIPGNSGGQQGSEFSRNSSGQQGSQDSGIPGSSANNQSTDRSSSPDGQRDRQNSSDANSQNGLQQNEPAKKNSPNSLDRGQKTKNKNNPHDDHSTNQNPDQANPLPENNSGKKNQRPKIPPINLEQLTNLLRIVAAILILVAGVIWYLWLQSRQEKIVKQKERKFNQLPMIERIYWLMLKELRTSGSIKHSNETEWEFALSKTQQLNTTESKHPSLLGKLIIEISADYVAWRYGKKKPNDSSLNHKFERFLELHREFCAAEQAKRKAASSMISQAKKHLVL